MSQQINNQHALQEFLANLQNRDRIKAALVLEHLPFLEKRTQTRVLYELSKSPDEFSLPLLFFLARKNPGLFQTQPELGQILKTKAADNPAWTGSLMQEGKEPGSKENLQLLNLLLAAPGASVRRQAREELQKLGEQALPWLAANLQSQDKDLLLDSLEILSEMQSENALYPVRRLLHARPEDPNLRFAAYEALGRLPVSKGAYALAAGLLDPAGSVRLAAAKALERNLDQGVLQGVQNMLQDDQERESVLSSLLEARCGGIILALLRSQEFRQEIVSYLQKSHPDLRSYYQELLQANGLQDLASDLQKEVQQSAGQGPVICCVDDSGLVLSLYRKQLFQLGLEPKLFQSALAALEWLQENSADLVFTDLSMPELSGVELIARVRRDPAMQSIILVAVTAQEESKSRQELLQAGADQVLGKPFTLQDLQNCLESFFPGNQSVGS
ncbi:MAG: response regulator [Thermodesulfobacteriota bacterium]